MVGRLVAEAREIPEARMNLGWIMFLALIACILAIAGFAWLSGWTVTPAAPAQAQPQIEAGRT